MTKKIYGLPVAIAVAMATSACHSGDGSGAAGGANQNATNMSDSTSADQNGFDVGNGMTNMDGDAGLANGAGSNSAAPTG